MFRKHASYEKHGNATHKEGQTKLYKRWANMRSRCYNKKSKSYGYYGGLGVTVCDEWLYSFSAYQKWMLDNGYDESKHPHEQQVDREDKNGPYSPDNCRIVTHAANMMNRRKFKNSTSKYVGVSRSSHESWQATLYGRPNNGKSFLGYFPTEIEALKHRNQVIRKEFGPNSPRLQNP